MRRKPNKDESAAARSRSLGRPHVVIIGAGFAGLNAATGLASADVTISLIDRRNHHLFQPLLYQVATAGLNPSDIAFPIRGILRDQDNVEVILGEVDEIDIAARTVGIRDLGEIRYDYLITATGAMQSYFGHPDWECQAPGLKTIEDALEIRRRILSAFEKAELTTDPDERNKLLTFVVVGGGPTGVELAGTIAEIATTTLVRDFRTIDPSDACIILIEGEDRLLGSYSPRLSHKAALQLADLGVVVRTDTMVSGVDENGVDTSEGRISAECVLWAAGVAASRLGRGLGVTTDRTGRVIVEDDLSVPGNRSVFVVGDLAHVKQDGEMVPGVAPSAIQQGRHAAEMINADLAGAERSAFRYLDKGSLATIGRSSAVGTVWRFEFWGFPAWMLWWSVHIVYLIGFRSRALVLFNWGWSWITYQRAARLITKPWAPHHTREEDPHDQS